MARIRTHNRRHRRRRQLAAEAASFRHFLLAIPPRQVIEAQRQFAESLRGLSVSVHEWADGMQRVTLNAPWRPPTQRVTYE